MSYELVSAQVSDLGAINNLIRRSKGHWGYDAAFMRKFMALFKMSVNDVITSTTELLYNNSAETSSRYKLAGFFSFSINTNNVLELDNFFIDPDYIGQGVGKILWDYLIDSVKSVNQTKFIIWSDPQAEGFYQKMGCKKIGSKPSPMMPGREPAVFEYTLVK